MWRGLFEKHPQIFRQIWGFNDLHRLPVCGEGTSSHLGRSLLKYLFQQTKCRFDKNRALVNLTSWAILPARDERALEIAVAKIGPIAASLNAAPHTFQLYQWVQNGSFFSAKPSLFLVPAFTTTSPAVPTWWTTRCWSSATPRTPGFWRTGGGITGERRATWGWEEAEIGAGLRITPPTL